jgi:uncharacterized membrane protein YGL010W
MNDASESPKRSFLDVYRIKHRNPINRALHTIGIPMIVASLIVVFFNWKVGLGMFLGGWVLQFVGHVFEGTAPAFFKNPIYLLVGPIWWVKKLFVRDRSKTSATSP